MPSLIHLPVAMLKAVALASAINDIRYYLNGVFVDVTNGQALIVATDGHRMHVGRAGAAPDAGGTVRVFIPSETVKQALAACAKGVSVLELVSLGGDGWRLGLVPFRNESGERFPDWRRVVPRELDAAAPGFPLQGLYLADFAKATALLGDKRGLARIYPAAGGGSVLVKFDATSDFVAVVAACRMTEAIRKNPNHPFHEMERATSPVWAR